MPFSYKVKQKAEKTYSWHSARNYGGGSPQLLALLSRSLGHAALSIHIQKCEMCTCWKACRPKFLQRFWHSNISLRGVSPFGFLCAQAFTLRIVQLQLGKQVGEITVKSSANSNPTKTTPHEKLWKLSGLGFHLSLPYHQQNVPKRVES